MDVTIIIHYILIAIQILILWVTYSYLCNTDTAKFKKKVKERDTEIAKLVADNKRLSTKNARLLKRLADSISEGYTYKIKTTYK